MATVPRTLNAEVIHDSKSAGRTVSIVSTSRENRFIIRPIGVVSKKTSGERMIATSMLLWRFADAATLRFAISMAENRTNIAVNEVTAQLNERKYFLN